MRAFELSLNSRILCRAFFARSSRCAIDVKNSRTSAFTDEFRSAANFRTAESTSSSILNVTFFIHTVYV